MLGFFGDDGSSFTIPYEHENMDKHLNRKPASNKRGGGVFRDLSWLTKKITRQNSLLPQQQIHTFLFLWLVTKVGRYYFIQHPWTKYQLHYIQLLVQYIIAKTERQSWHNIIQTRNQAKYIVGDYIFYQNIEEDYHLEHNKKNRYKYTLFQCHILHGAGIRFV